MTQRFWQAVAFSALILLPLSSQASRQITDQIGRTVTVPDDVNRVVVTPQGKALADYLVSEKAKAILLNAGFGA